MPLEINPHEQLIAARDAARQVRQSNGGDAPAALDLADAFAKLDAWLVTGGWLPSAWYHPYQSRAPRRYITNLNPGDLL